MRDKLFSQAQKSSVVKLSIFPLAHLSSPERSQSSQITIPQSSTTHWTNFVQGTLQYPGRILNNHIS